MTNEVLAPSAPSDELVMAESFVEAVYDDLNDIKHSFFRIGFRLHEAAQLGYYKQLGYANITELAEDKFGFKQSTTYELIAIYRLAHKEAAPMQIAEPYEAFSQSQLRELCRLKMDPWGFMRIVKSSDTVVNIGKAVTFWNKYVTKHSGGPKVNSITELLQLEIETPIEGVQGYLQLKADEAAYYEEHPEAKPQQGQLPGQMAIDFPEQEEPKEIEDSAYAESSEAEIINAPFVPTYGLNDDEIINYCLKYATSLINSKLKIYDKFNTSPLKSEFIEFVKTEYGLGSFSAYKFGDENSPYINCDALSNALVIRRKNGSSKTIELPWAYVAGRISRLIETDNYLTSEEKKRFLKWKADNDGLTVNEEPATCVVMENSAYAEKLSFKNEKARRKWLDEFRDWGVWLEVPQIDMTFYRFDFANGAALLVEVGYEYWSFSATPGAQERVSYSIIDDEHPKFNSKGISYTDVITWLTAHSKEI